MGEKELVTMDDKSVEKYSDSADPAALAAAETAKQRIQAGYVMAFRKPRNSDDARQRILKSCKRPKFAERVQYSKPVGGSVIQGPSIRFAELAVREWGNIACDIQCVYEDDNVRRSKVFMTDLETNTTFAKEITIKKTVERKNAKGREVIGDRTNTFGKKVYIVIATDDELHNKEAALISKVVRNEGLRLIPSDVIDEAIDTANETLKKGIKSDPDAAKKKILDAFGDLGVTPSDIEQYLGHSTDRIALKEIENLRHIYETIREGDSTWEEYCSVESPPKAEDVNLDDVVGAKVVEEPKQKPKRGKPTKKDIENMTEEEIRAAEKAEEEAFMKSEEVKL
jgi:hypothetical protein